ncbi:MAG TPA: GNAT family N-acetyltransferase [Flavitalea sp.]|nr:GNAT family N-acetyltransferase [Flavitalea sp.]
MTDTKEDTTNTKRGKLFMILQTTRLYVRPFTEKDLEVFFELNGDEQVMRYIRTPKSREGSALFLTEVIDNYQRYPGLGRWAVIEKLSDACIGMFSLLTLEHTNDIHIGYALFPNHWGRGFADELVKAGLEHAYKELRLPSVVAVTHSQNLASQKILLNNSFEYTGFYNTGERNEFLYRHNEGPDVQNSG